MSLVWYSKHPLKIAGLFVYQATKNISDGILAEELQKLLATENLPHYNSSSIRYNFKEGLLVPSAHYKEADREKLLACMYGEMPAAKYYSASATKPAATHIFAVPEVVDDVLSTRFFGADVSSSNPCLIEYAAQKELFCIIYNSYIKAILHVNGKLQIVQLYDYNTPADVAYHLLNVCQQHQISASEITLTLSGYIVEQSNLYEELYRYFLNIKMDDLSADIELNDEIREQPAHFFSFLIALVQCAS
ncbi:MAG: DUF3822 family protein [Chitinophagaceae bacterium]|nr:MAG: DUF3822 family protein [Chitinophagaceae bacterium]